MHLSLESLVFHRSIVVVSEKRESVQLFTLKHFELVLDKVAGQLVIANYCLQEITVLCLSECHFGDFRVHPAHQDLFIESIAHFSH